MPRPYAVSLPLQAPYPSMLSTMDRGPITIAIGASHPLGSLFSAPHRRTTLCAGIANLRRTRRMNRAVTFSQARTNHCLTTPMRLHHCHLRRLRKVPFVAYVFGHRFRQDHECPVYRVVQILHLAAGLDAVACTHRQKRATLFATARSADHRLAGGLLTRWTAPSWCSHLSNSNPLCHRPSVTPRRHCRFAFFVRKMSRRRYRRS